jgi:hypothetical protein
MFIKFEICFAMHFLKPKKKGWSIIIKECGIAATLLFWQKQKMKWSKTETVFLEQYVKTNDCAKAKFQQMGPLTSESKTHKSELLQMLKAEPRNNGNWQQHR